jgi:hypothetical protein
LLERHPISVEIITQPSSRNKGNLKAWKIVFVIKDLIAVTTLHFLEVSWDGLWTPSGGLSQCHGHDFWFVCEVAFKCT